MAELCTRNRKIKDLYGNVTHTPIKHFHAEPFGIVVQMPLFEWSIVHSLIMLHLDSENQSGCFLNSSCIIHLLFH